MLRTAGLGRQGRSQATSRPPCPTGGWAPCIPGILGLLGVCWGRVGRDGTWILDLRAAVARTRSSPHYPLWLEGQAGAGVKLGACHNTIVVASIHSGLKKLMCVIQALPLTMTSGKLHIWVSVCSSAKWNY